MSESPQTALFGTWKSPISASSLAAQKITLEEVEVDESTGRIYHLEERPGEGGRGCIVEDTGSGPKDVLPRGFSARSGVHEYGGAAMRIGPNGQIVFTDWDTRGVYSLDPDSGTVTPLLKAESELRYADFDVHPSSKWILAVQEDHRTGQNLIVTIDVTTKTYSPVAQGCDFYMFPQFSPDGKSICWIEWKHPGMPWTGTTLKVAGWDDIKGTVGEALKIAGNELTESITQPRWNKDGSLLFTSDTTGYWQLYILLKGETRARQIKLEGFDDAEFAECDWLLGSCTYVPLNLETVIAAYTRNATNGLVLIDLKSDTCTELHYPYVQIECKALRRVSNTKYALIGRTTLSPQELCLLDVSDPSSKAILKTSINIDLPSSTYSQPEHISFPRVFGQDRGGLSHAFFYPPCNPAYQAPSSTKPPLIIYAHGGPTSHATPGLSLECQYWTTRGYAYAQINYAGSSGYGRAYRDLLYENWGIIDIADTASLVAYINSTGRVDPTRVGIIGGSAGGYQVLESLCSYPQLWAGGVSRYGVSAVKPLTEQTHKFESRYIDFLLFANKALTPEEKDKIYRERSPCFQADKITAPLLLLQGTDDCIVPPNQVYKMEQVIKEKGGDVKVVMFKGEGHGWRMGSTVLKATEEEEAFFKRTLVRE
ncbi:MAG: hypothetical protein M1834_007496 [Cirrosporium novae-zelandiae]|nr:MAG: hypothetical protein M1834_007496 [Cirrosporium novae-zelandiae]